MNATATALDPGVRAQLENLVAQHRQLDDGPLLLALTYDPPRALGDLFLFEVVEGFGDGDVSPERNLFEVTFESTAGFPMSRGQRLHLVLTNPDEFRAAASEGWQAFQELRDAVAGDQADVLYSDATGRQLLELIR